jgi:VWFA-related protein
MAQSDPATALGGATMKSVRVGRIVLFGLGAALAAVSPPTHAQQTTPVFRAQSTVVSVNVAVKMGNKPVANLTAADFALTDNGVVQKIDAVQIEAVPVDVTLAIDVSGSTRGLLETYRQDVIDIGALLRPIDRLRLIAFGTTVDEPMALQALAGRPPVERILGGAKSAVYDGIVAAILRPVSVDRRHLVVVFTDGYDNHSVTSPEWLNAASRRTEAVVHIVSRRPPQMSTTELLRSQVSWQPPPLDDVAETTGGAMHEPSTAWTGGRSGILLGDFKKIFDDFRQSYVLRFTPTGVKKDGWHDLVVSLTRPGKFTIRARRGYAG